MKIIKIQTIYGFPQYHVVLKESKDYFLVHAGFNKRSLAILSYKWYKENKFPFSNYKVNKSEVDEKATK